MKEYTAGAARSSLSRVLSPPHSLLWSTGALMPTATPQVIHGWNYFQPFSVFPGGRGLASLHFLVNDHFCILWGRRGQKAGLWEPQANCWETWNGCLCSSWLQLRRTPGSQWWRSYLRQGRMQSVPNRGSQVTLQLCDRANSPWLNPTLFSLIIWLMFVSLVLSQKPSVFFSQTSNQTVQNKHAACCYTSSAQVEEPLWVGMRQTSNPRPDDKASIAFMSGNQRHRGPHLLRGMAGIAALPPAESHGVEPGTREV